MLLRREFIGASAGAALCGLRAWQAHAADRAPSMRIAEIETVYWPDGAQVPFSPNWTWVRVQSDTGVSGYGETYSRNAAQAEMVHSHVARLLLKKDPRDIERIWADLYHLFDYQIAGGAEMRVLSAVDLALWDLLGKALDTPVYRLLGGRANPRIRVYNTCHGQDFMKDAQGIMRGLIDRYGVKAIKIWPFDAMGRRNKGQFITPADIEEAIVPLKKLRDAFGHEIEILLEFHSLWNVPSAIKIARAVEPYKPMWLEDMLLPGNFAQYRELSLPTPIPLTIGERMAGKLQFQSLLDSRAAKYVMFDVCWCGGLTEAKKIAAMADASQLPVAAHTAGGPLLFYASTQLSTSCPNVAIQESVQPSYEKRFPQVVENPVVPRDGFITAPEEPGLGMRIKPEVWNHPAAIRRVSKAS
jgi:L-alanine-DL-glutamate epimerase-like enolase superfamily enzyme